jgi:hypothetical protein
VASTPCGTSASRATPSARACAACVSASRRRTRRAEHVPRARSCRSRFRAGARCGCTRAAGQSGMGDGVIARHNVAATTARATLAAWMELWGGGARFRVCVCVCTRVAVGAPENVRPGYCVCNDCTHFSGWGSRFGLLSRNRECCVQNHRERASSVQCGIRSGKKCICNLSKKEACRGRMTVVRDKDEGGGVAHHFPQRARHARCSGAVSTSDLPRCSRTRTSSPSTSRTASKMARWCGVQRATLRSSMSFAPP